MMNRKQQPDVGEIDKIEFVKPVLHTFKNGITFHELQGGAQPVIRLQFFMEAGSNFQEQKLQALFTASQLLEGTKKYNSKQIADQLDYYGAFVQTDVDDRFSSITLHCLERNFAPVWNILQDVILNPTFPVAELETNLKNAKQKLMVNMNKVEFLARRAFLPALFGENHPYGNHAQPEDYDFLKSSHLVMHYQNLYNNTNVSILATGNFSNAIQNTLEKELNFNNMGSKSVWSSHAPTGKPNKIKVNKKGAVQCGMRIGKILFNRTYPDYAGMSVLNTLLGGYFGSRLMSNIREDKGYTYGIGSTIANFPDTGVFLIATEVGKEVYQDALKEIYFEIEKLQNELVNEGELNLVRNYMLGSLLRNSDGPFAMADQFRMLQIYGLDYSYFDNLINTIHTITPNRIQELAQKYLQIDSLTEVVAGDI